MRMHAWWQWALWGFAVWFLAVCAILAWLSVCGYHDPTD